MERLPSRITFIYYDLPSCIQRMRRWRAGKALYYVLWQWFAVRALRRQCPSLPFDHVQHVTYVSMRYPSFMGLLQLPFYFGPVSGGEVVPPSLRSGFSAGQQCRELLRSLSNRLVRFDPLMRRTFRQADKIFVTRDTLPLLPQFARKKSTETLAIGVTSPPISSIRRSAKPNFELLYAGRLLEWKGIDLALRAVELVRRAGLDVELIIAGGGPAKHRLLNLCSQLQLNDAVYWTGWLPRAKIENLYRNSTLLLFPSLRDSGGMVVLEALAAGLPVVCTDLGGPGLMVDRTCGRAVSTAGRTPEQLAKAMAEALLEVLTTPHLLNSLSWGARVRAQEFAFEQLVRSVYPEPSNPMVLPA